MGMHGEGKLCFSVLLALGYQNHVIYALSKPHSCACWSKLLGSLFYVLFELTKH